MPTPEGVSIDFDAIIAYFSSERYLMVRTICEV